MGGGDDPDRHERTLYRVDTEILNSLGGADAADGDKGFLGALIGARGCIEGLSGDPVSLRVSVAWQCLTETRAPALPCGEDGYGNEAKRRVLAIRVTLADLN
jgi:type IV pilus assembly protein PilV